MPQFVQLLRRHALRLIGSPAVRVESVERNRSAFWIAVRVGRLAQQGRGVIPLLAADSVGHPHQFAEAVGTGLKSNDGCESVEDFPKRWLGLSIWSRLAICSEIPCSISPSRIAFWIRSTACFCAARLPSIS
jgi:hypothetical protein